MHGYNYYNTIGNPITQEAFIDFYNAIYFYSNDYRTEEQIEKIYDRNHVITASELISFLRWKVGDRTNGADIITQYGQHIATADIESLAEQISSWDDKCGEELYELIINQHIKNLGAVYTLAIVSLITKGREPVYDKFAEIALDVIIGKHAFREPMEYKEMPDKGSVLAVIDRSKSYKKKLEAVFEEKWKEDRRVDRALWTYGHMFR